MASRGITGEENAAAEECKKELMSEFELHQSLFNKFCSIQHVVHSEFSLQPTKTFFNNYFPFFPKY